ncbi:unnamed protein product, partial [Brassica rapa subsp. trilocularis]
VLLFFLTEQERDHDQGENQKLSLYQAFSLKTLLADYLLLIAYKDTQISQHHLMYTQKKSLLCLHKPSTQALSYHNVSQAYMFKAPMVTVKNGSSSRYGLMLN